MKLSDIKKNADAKAAEVEVAHKHAQLMAELDVHPLLKWGCDRNVRDAYFCGIVFAAMTDDVEIDANERKAIERIGCSLSLSVEEIEELISSVTKTVNAAVEAVDPATGAGGDEVFAVLEESAVTLASDKVFRMFFAEYVKVCGTKEFDAKDVKEQLSAHVATRIGRDLNQFIAEDMFDALCRVVRSGRDFNRDDLFKLSDWLGEDVVRYLMLDAVGDDVRLMIDECRMDEHRIMLVSLLNVRRTMLDNRVALPAKLAEIIEGDDAWPVEFHPADYQQLFDASGIAEPEARAFVRQNLLPKMRSSFERAVKRIDDAPRCHEDICGCMRNGVKLDSCSEFRVLFRYAVFMNAFLGLDKLTARYGFSGPSDALWEYCTCSTNLDRLEMDDWSMSQSELDEYLCRWESIFKIVELMDMKNE